MEILFLIFVIVTSVSAMQLVEKPVGIPGETVHELFEMAKKEGVSPECLVSVVKLVDQFDATSNHDNVDLRENHMTAPEIIENRGYPHKEYLIETPDGYILTLVHITGSPYAEPCPKRKYPVFIQHGFLQDSAMAVMGPREIAIGFYLADRGFDVFLGNARGTELSQGHVNYDSNNRFGPFWNFTFNEKGTIDIPAFVDKVLEITGARKLTYIGHSEGTTNFFVAGSQIDDFQKKISVMFGLGPAATFSFVSLPIRVLCTASFLEQITLDGSGVVEYKPGVLQVTDKILDIVCSSYKLKNPSCNSLLFALAGVSTKILLDGSVVIAHTDQSSPIREIQHMCQAAVKGRFAEFDYGLPSRNLRVYGSEFPPLYDVSKIKTKVYLYSGTCDMLTTPGDAKLLASRLPNAEVIYIDLYNHMDYLYAEDADKMVYSGIVEKIEKIEKTKTCK